MQEKTRHRWTRCLFSSVFIAVLGLEPQRRRGYLSSVQSGGDVAWLPMVTRLRRTRIRSYFMRLCGQKEQTLYGKSASGPGPRLEAGGFRSDRRGRSDGMEMELSSDLHKSVNPKFLV